MEDNKNTGTGKQTTNSTPNAIIGKKIRIKGELVGEEDLTIQGYIEGIIDLKGNNLTIGKDGVLKANVSAKNIIIEGSVEGDLFGEEKIEIRESSNVRGNLVADRVTLEDGAKFRGSIDMDTSAKNPDLLKPKTNNPAQRPANPEPARENLARVKPSATKNATSIPQNIKEQRVAAAEKISSVDKNRNPV
ncbi:MAG: polymer-forming cytoskeletal protein [Spongiibacteraceae bacterium]|nr:polymer-forming cytoskeletal protein [Spongiibacteraceae bacterium]